MWNWISEIKSNQELLEGKTKLKGGNKLSHWIVISYKGILNTAEQVLAINSGRHWGGSRICKIFSHPLHFTEYEFSESTSDFWSYPFREAHMGKLMWFYESDILGRDCCETYQIVRY